MTLRSTFDAPNRPCRGAAPMAYSQGNGTTNGGGARRHARRSRLANEREASDA